MIKSKQNNLKQLLPENLSTTSAYTGNKLSNAFTKTKHQTLKETQHDKVYYADCPENTYTENYTNETGRCSVEWVIDYNGRDTKSQLFK